MADEKREEHKEGQAFRVLQAQKTLAWFQAEAARAVQQRAHMAAALEAQRVRNLQKGQTVRETVSEGIAALSQEQREQLEKAREWAEQSRTVRPSACLTLIT